MTTTPTGGWTGLNGRFWGGNKLSDSIQRIFKVSIDTEARAGDMDLWIDFVELMDERRLTLWTVMLQKTFVMLTMVGGTGGSVVHPASTRTRLTDHQTIALDGRTIAKWTFSPVDFDPNALRILCNLIEHSMYHIAKGDEPIGSVMAEVVFDSKSWARQKFERLVFPKAWPNLPYAVEDFDPETGDFDIELELTGAPTKETFQMLRTVITPWLTTLERGGFMGHPLQTWKFGRDTSEEPFQTTRNSLIIRLRDFYSDYAALDSLYNVLIRACDIHPIRTVWVGE